MSFLKHLASIRPRLLKPPSHSTEEELYRHTFGRWLYNEDLQMSKRYVKFNYGALVKIAVEAVSARSCTSFRKISEGMFNRVFLLGFDNGREAIARFPFPLVGSPHLVTASEVATMDFARTVLEIPVPRVLAWSSRPNDVGAEFIICEKAPGVEMKEVWANTRYQDFMNLAHISKAVYDIEKKFISCQFSSYGSIFYKEDLEGLPRSKDLWADGRRDEASARFAIGPMMIWDLWRGDRSMMDIDRGPWFDPQSFVAGLVKREREWIRRFAVPRPQGDPFLRSEADNSPAKHIEALAMYLAASERLVFDETFAAPTLWHTDLHQSNIFVSPTPPHDILAVIDWQGVSVAPLATQVVFPKALKYNGKNFHPDHKVPMPPLPGDFKTRSQEEQVALRREQLDAVMQLYHGRLMQKDPLRMASQGFPDAETIVEPIHAVSRSWNAGLHVICYWLARTQRRWLDILGPDAPPCPFDLSPEEIEKAMREYERWRGYRDQVDAIEAQLGIHHDGWVAIDRYEEVEKACEKLRKAWDSVEAGGPYPFQDGAPSTIV